LFKIITLNEQVEKEAATRTDILHFFGQENFILIGGKSGNFEKGCLWQLYISFGVFCSAKCIGFQHFFFLIRRLENSQLSSTMMSR